MKENCRFSTSFIIVNTIILGLITGLSHFAYELSGNLVLVGLFNPINESVWEHLKFMFFPNLLLWIIIFVWKNNKCDLDLQKWIIATAVSVFVAPLMVLLFFYTYSGALGFESLIVDIAFVFVCYFITLNLAFHIYKFVNKGKGKVIVSLIIIILLFILFIVFTFYPLHIPLFYDTPTGTYGILKLS